ncbi:hypothetical protein GJ744_011807 [Endocarpon pusillum]|uniref:Uncharacterized protein n=1 Tax=Endocarpon pusillum TaxID=364733 RepID=A0A8H7AFT8_9EURO|nr:hypothetical protein GJ744_011807 [Endocarpon pusillum]
MPEAFLPDKALCDCRRHKYCYSTRAIHVSAATNPYHKHVLYRLTWHHRGHILPLTTPDGGVAQIDGFPHDQAFENRSV